MRARLFLLLTSIVAIVAVATAVLSGQLDAGRSGSDQVVSGTGGDAGGEAGGEPGTSRPAVAPGEVSVTGTVTTVLVTGAVLHPREVPAPLTVVSERGFGNGGEVTSVLVDGQPSTIVWDGGRPFQLSSGGSLVLDPVNVALRDDGLRLVLGGGAHALTPGRYQLDTPVAVGTTGVATPHDAVAFEAGADSLLEARGDAALVLGAGAPHRLTGPGQVLLGGTLELTTVDGTRTSDVLAVGEGPYDLTFEVADDGTWRVEGLLAGPILE